MAESLPPLRIDPALLRPARPTAAVPPSAANPTTASPPATPPAKAVPAAAAPAAPAQTADYGGKPADPTASATSLADALAREHDPALVRLPTPTPAAGAPAADPVTRITADRILGRNEVETVAEGNVVMTRLDSRLEADRVTYQQIEDEVDATGNVRLSRDADRMAGPHLHMRVGDYVGYFEQPAYSITRTPKAKTAVQAALAPKREAVTGIGEAERIDFEGEDLYRLRNATFSTCRPDQRDWQLEARELRLDYNREHGEADDVKVRFKDTPILYTPWLSFALNNQRKSGLLTPTFGSTTTSGLELTLPWYWNIAPNMDATISPRVMSKRGLQLNGEFRYLEAAYTGQARVEYLPGDQITGTNRSAYSLLHNHNFGHGFTGALNLNGASDNTYFTDLSSRISVVAQTNLLRQGNVAYNGGWWNANLMAQRYQTLQDPAAPVVPPYFRLPQLLVNGLRPDLPAGLAFNFTGEYVNFSHPTLVRSKRTLFYPQLSLPLRTAAFFVTPKLGMHFTRYNLENQDAGVPDQITRNLPIASVDGGVVLEREIDWLGRSLIQTLEPRLYYVYVPNRDQGQIPLFDSALADFNFAQIFSENRYGGSDRIGDANQLTAAIVSRLIDPATGGELVRGALGQRYYFNTQRVTLPGETARTDRKTDLLAALSGMLLPRVYLDTGWQYSPSFQRTERLNVGARYQPEIGKVLNAGYRYTRDQLGQIDLSAQWPLWGGWHGVGRYNYSTKERRLVEGVAGLEYEAGCWVARFVLHRLATQTTRATTAVFVQLELNGFSRIGSNPLEMLKRNVPGYGIINNPTADPVFAAY